MDKNNTFALIAQARGAANDYLTRELNRHGLEGLVPTHGSILAALTMQGEMSMTALAQLIRRRKSTVTALVSKLEALGYVERFASSEDSRVTMVRLTPKGKALQNPFAVISEGLLATGLRGFSDEELQTLQELIIRIIHNFD